MTEQATAIVSVRGEAQATVAPDCAVLNGTLLATEDTKAAALQTAASRLQQLTDDLAEVGGVARAPESERHPLTWSAYSATTHDERMDMDQYGMAARTGRTVAAVTIIVTVRAFDLLDRLGVTLARQESFNVDNVSWHVDSDNPAWRTVRAAAIGNAIEKGRDYATALGGAVVRVEHVADAGLLGGDGAAMQRTARPVSFGAGRPDTPSLDPAPQQLVAVIDARFIATVAAL